MEKSQTHEISDMHAYKRMTCKEKKEKKKIDLTFLSCVIVVQKNENQMIYRRSS